MEFVALSRGAAFEHLGEDIFLGSEGIASLL